MGLTKLTIEIASFGKTRKWRSIELPLAPRAIFSVIQADVLRKLGIQPSVKQEFFLPDGSRVMCRKGIALFRYGKKIGGADTIFGEPGDREMLGSLALGAVGLCFDPLTRELKPLPMILATHRAAYRAALLPDRVVQ
jgi:hypothetical protein